MWEIYKEPQIIAESIPAMAEMLLGFGKFTKAGRLAMGVDAAEKAGDVAAATKLTKELAENVSNSQKAMYRVAQNAGLLTFAASQTNNQIEERVKNNQEAGPYRDWETDRKSTRLNSSHSAKSRMPSSA